MHVRAYMYIRARICVCIHMCVMCGHCVAYVEIVWTCCTIVTDCTGLVVDVLYPPKQPPHLLEQPIHPQA